MEQAIINGASIVCHGMLFGGGDKPDDRKILFLDCKDMFYKLKSQLPQSNILISENIFSDLADMYESNLDMEYNLSRICALREGSIFCDAHKRTIILET
jgi:hypothetical protein